MGTSALALLFGAVPVQAQTVTIGNNNVIEVPGTLIPTHDILYVGSLADGTSGTLNITDGGTVTTNAYVWIGNSSTGMVKVSGGSASMLISESLNLGALGGTGTLVIEDGGTVTSSQGTIGRLSSTDTVTVSGGGSSWDNDGRLTVGLSGGAGTLTIEAGGTVTSKDFLLGVTAESFGGSMGTLNIGAGGTLTNTLGFIGEGFGSTGTVTVSGEDALWENTDLLVVGRHGNGTLTIKDGGKVITNANGHIGYESGSIGVATVSGTQAVWESDALSVGLFGTGTLTVEAGGLVSTEYVTLGVSTNGNGTVNLNGDTVNGRGVLETAYVEGRPGFATLSLNGGILRARENQTNFLRDFGALTVGSGGAWFDTNGFNVTIGASTAFAGSSSLNKLGLGTLTLTGDSSTFAGTTNIDGGTLAIVDGGKLSGKIGYIGHVAGSEGAVTVSGNGSTWTQAVSLPGEGQLLVGYSGTGELTIGAGGTVTNKMGILGSMSGSRGTVTISGADARWTNADNLFVGTNGVGELTIGAGGMVSVEDGSGDPGTASLGSFGGSSGRINIGAASADPGDAAGAGILSAAALDFGAGTGKLNFNHTGPDHEFSAALQSSGNGAHALNHYAGITALTGNSSGFTGTTTVSGGTLTVTDRLAGLASVTTGGRFVVKGTFGGNVEARTGGIVSGTGIISGDGDFTDHGVLAGEQGQTLTISGDAFFDDTSRINVALGGATTNALFEIGDDLTLDGTLYVTDAGGFGVGVYRLFDYGGMLIDNGLDIGSMPTGIDPGSLLIQTSLNSQINLISTGGATLGFWDGGNMTANGTVDGGAGIWNGTNSNWTSSSGNLNLDYFPNPTYAVFQGTAGAVAVDDSAGAISVTGMQFASNGYHIGGDAITLEGAGGQSIIRVGNGSTGGAGMTATIASELTGASMLVKNDYGTLILSGANTYTGGTRIDRGVLSVSDDDNLGDPDGGLTFNGGTLATTESFVSNRNITLDLAGRFDVADATTLGLGGPVTGSGDLLKQGTGTLVLTGTTNSYGNTAVEAGMLIGNAASIQGNIGNAGTVVFNEVSDASFAGDVVGYNGADGVMTKRGAGELTLTGTSALNWTVEAGGLVSASDRFGGNAAIDSGASFSFDQSSSASYAGILSGSGSFAKAGSGTVLLTGDSSAFAGSTTVTGGHLVVGQNGIGALGGSLTIQSDGLLAGSGNLGSVGSTVTIAAGAVHAPGNSISVQHVLGDYANHGTLRIEATPAEADRIVVAGAVDITGATLDLVLSPADAASWGVFNGPFTIIDKQSTGAVVGAFDPVTRNLLFLDTLLDYQGGDGNDVTLALERNDLAFAGVAQTRNQIATATAIDTLDNSHAVWASIALTGDPGIVRQSFDALSGEIHASAMGVLVEDSRFVRNAINDRIRAAFGDVAELVTPVLAYGPGDTPVLVSPDHAGPVFWSHGLGSWGSTDSDGNAASLDRSTGGLLLGADAPVGDWRIGLLAGYSHSSFDAKDHLSSGKSDNYHVGLYGGTEWGEIAVRAGLAYSWHDIETNRAVAIPGVIDSLSGGYNAGVFQAFGELGYGFDTHGVRFEPFANLAHVSLRTDGFTEQGGSAALGVAGSTTNATFTTLGLRTEHVLALGTVDVTLRGTVGWRHAFGDTTPEGTHAFSAGDLFTIAGAPIARNSAVVEAGLDFSLSPGASLGLSYTGQFASGARDHGFKANLTVRF